MSDYTKLDRRAGHRSAEHPPQLCTLLTDVLVRQQEEPIHPVRRIQNDLAKHFERVSSVMRARREPF
jgi:hypothetical protein